MGRYRLTWQCMLVPLLLGWSVASARAQGYPEKPVRLVVPFAAGSATDTVARLLAQGLSERTKATFIVEDRPGANGAIAADYVAKSAPDGYTLFMATVSTHSQVPWLMKKPPYDAIKDFVPIAGIGGFSFVIVVHPSLPARTVREFVALAKSYPGNLPYGAPGGTSQICSETLRRRAGVSLALVPYKSSPQAITELIAGQIGMICSDFATAIAHIKSGKIRALALTTAKRSDELPDIPTLKETFADITEMRSWIGVLAPAGTPDSVVERLAPEIKTVIGVPAFKTRLAPLGFELLTLDARELAAYMQSELAKWGELIKQAGIEAQ